MEIDALCRRQQLDREDGRDVRLQLAEPAGGERRHADVILLVGAGRQAVDARRVRHLPVLGGERRGRDLGAHEAGVEAGILDQERRQRAELGVDQKCHATLGKRADLGDRDRQRIGGEGDRLGVEVAAG